jgi:Icc protein
VSADSKALYRGVNARDALLRVVDQAVAWRPDLLLLTGDLSEDDSPESYGFLAATLESTGLPVVTTPGNHDDPRLQNEHFPGTATDEPLVIAAGSWQLIVLNSSVEGRVPGALTKRMMDGLAASLELSSAPKLVALHHHPLAVGSEWIDRYPLLEPGRFWDLLDGNPNVHAVVWGHIHHAFRAERGGMTLLGAPSTVSNSRAFRPEFEPDPAGPACRWLKLADGGGLSSGILRDAAGIRTQATPATG